MYGNIFIVDLSVIMVICDLISKAIIEIKD